MFSKISKKEEVESKMNVKKHFYLNSIILVAIFSLSACSSKTIQLINNPQYTLLPKNKARIILDREKKNIGSSLSYKIYDDNTYIGIIGNGGRLTWDRNPGKFKLKAISNFGNYESHPEKTCIAYKGEIYEFSITLDKSRPEFELVFVDAQSLELIDYIKAEEETLQKQVDSCIASNDLKSLKKYTDENPNAVYYIKDKSIRLALTGPKGLKVGDIRKYIKEGKSELILVSLIKSAKSPYKEFTMEEIETLLEMGLSDKIVSAMIDVTTLLYRDAKLKEEQLFLINEQRKISEQNRINYNNSNQSVDKQGNPIAKKIQEEAIKQGIGLLLDNLF